MKKVCALGMLAAAAIAFSGCSKEVEIQDKSAGTHTLTFTVQKDIDTKTAVQEGDGVASYVWTKGDEAYIHVFENGKESTEKTVTFSSDYKIATVQATFADYDTTAFSYSAVYGSSLANKTHNPLIPSAQSPRLDSFDPAADVLVSNEPIEFEGKAKAAEDAEFKFVMKRVVSANKMTLKGLVPGEKVTKVELASDKYFASRYMIETKDYKSDAKKLVLDFSGINAVVGNDGSFPVYFTSAPVDEASFSVTVTTDQHVYTRDNFTSKLTFAVGTFRRFGINLYGYGEEISTGVEYTLVDSNDDLYDGATYLLVGASSQSSTLYALGEQRTNNRAAVVVVDNNGVITIDNTINAYPIIIETVAGGYTLKDASTNYYLYNSDTGNNRLHSRENVEDNNAVWTINISNGVASVNNVGNLTKGVLCFNPTWQNNTDSNPLFAAYGSAPTNGTAALALYVDLTTCKPALATPNVLAEVQNNNEIYVTWDEVANADGYIVTCAGEADQNIATGVGEATFTNLADGTYTVTVTAISNDHSAYLDSKPATVEDILVGSPKGTVENPYTVAEVIARINGDNTDACYIAGKISSVHYFYDASHATATYFISDDGETTSAQFEAFSVKFLENKQWVAGNSQIAVGDDVVIYAGGLQIYKETTYETTANSGSFLYSLNGVTSETVPSISKTDITGISADGISNATATVTFTNADGWDVAVAPDETIVTAASISGTTITYSVGANNGSARTGSITVTLTKNGRTDVSAIINVAQDANSSSPVTTHTSTLTFTAKCNGSGTADDNVAWSVTSDGAESNFDATRGIHYGTNNDAVKYIQLSTSDIPGTITKVVVNAAAASTATVSVTVNGSEFGGNAKQLTSSAANYTFEGSASGEIIVTVTKSQSAKKALYVKSIVVTYEN